MYVRLALLILAVVAFSPGGATDWGVFTRCVNREFTWRDYIDGGVLCGAWQMINAYRTMQTKQCVGCDKYFHCQGNFNAVTRCASPGGRRAAEIFSNCREFSQGGVDSPDGAADDAANRHGRNGGDCTAAYTCMGAARVCKYNPADGTCAMSNC